MLKASAVKQLLEKIKELEEKQGAFIDSIPSEINNVFFDNTYTNSLQEQISLLLGFAFGELKEDVTYFLYENYPQKVYVKVGDVEQEYVLNSVDDYINYLIEIDCIENDLM